jgi:hypothetical protein
MLCKACVAQSLPHTGSGFVGTFLAILRFFRGGLGAGGAFRFFSAGTHHPGTHHTVEPGLRVCSLASYCTCSRRCCITDKDIDRHPSR